MKNEFLGKVCPFAVFFVIGFALNVLFLISTGLSLLTIEPGTESYFVALLTIASSSLVLVVTFPLLYLCRQYNKA